MALRLRRLDGENGFRIGGINDYEWSGSSVAGAGDVNGDGIDDVVVGAPGADREESYDTGESYVVFGSADGFDASLDLSALDGADGFRLEGADTYYGQSGSSVSGAGDVNGDGIDDLIVGAPGHYSGLAGETHVVFGSSTGFAASLDLADLDGTNGFRLVGSDPAGRSGWSVAGAGDVDGDGIDDMIIGAPGAAGYTGESYVVFGSSGGFPADLDLAELDGANGFRLTGIDDQGIDGGDFSGTSVAGAGDVNGDGIDDLIIGASGADRGGRDGVGESYVVFGSSAGFDASLDLAALDGKNGFRLDGSDGAETSGASVAGAGDVNGDGIDDLIIGAANPGESYVVFGSDAGFPGRVDLSTLDGANGFLLERVDQGEASGNISVAGAGDFNGDGIDDLIVGAPGADRGRRDDAGESYVVFGSAAGFDARLDLAALNGANGFRLDGIVGGDRSGSSVAGAGDVNGDGFDDLIIGAPGADRAGESYVVFGFRPAIKGGPGADELAGTEFGDLVFGRADDDALDGGKGRDRLLGGWGDDRIIGGRGRDHIIGGHGDDRINGSTGRDRLIGGLDDDDLTGGGGADVFVFGLTFGFDRLRDFDADPEGGRDRIDLRRLGITEAGFAEAVTIADLGEDTEVVVEGHGTILCEDVSGDALGRSDFLLLA